MSIRSIERNEIQSRGDPTSQSLTVDAPRHGTEAVTQEKGLSKRALLNSVAATVDFLARSIVEFLLNPFLVGRLGSYLYGAWRVLVSMTGYLWAASGRSAPVLASVIANRHHSADPVEKRQTVGSAVVTWVLFLPLLGAIGGLVAWFAPVYLKSSADTVGTVRATAALLVLDAIVVTLMMLPKSVLQGENLGYKRMGLSGALLMVQGALMALAVVMGAGIVGVAAANVAGSVVMGFMFWRVARKHVDWFGIQRPTRAMVRRFFGLNWWFTAWKFVMEFLRGGDVVLLGLFAPLELVAVYALSKFVPDAISNVLANPLQGITPGLGAVIGAGEFERAIKLRSEFMAFTWVVVTAAGATVLLWNESFVSLWVGPKFFPGHIATLLIVLIAFQFIVFRTDAWVIDVTLRVATKVLLGIASVIVCLGLAALLVGAMDLGILGIAAGFLGGRALLTVSYPWIVGRFLGQRPWDQIKGCVRPVLATVAIFALCMSLSYEAFVDSWIQLVLVSSATGLVVLAAAAVVGLTGEQRTRFLGRLARIRRQVAGSR